MGKALKILVPFDGSKNSVRALVKAIQLAKGSRGSITGLHVINTPLSKDAGSILKSWRNKAKQNAVDVLDRAKGRADMDKVKFISKIANGPPGEVITNFANKNKFDVVVIGARGLSKTQAMFLGSVSNHVMNKSKVPVMVVK